eukprot:303883-Chlamydomonas_euryale.AAC.2
MFSLCAMLQPGSIAAALGSECVCVCVWWWGRSQAFSVAANDTLEGGAAGPAKLWLPSLAAHTLREPA